LRLRTQETVMAVEYSRHNAVAARNSTRRSPLVLLLAEEAEWASRSASTMSFQKWVRKTHCGTRRVPVTRGWDGASGPRDCAPCLKIPVAPLACS
jgi:hypothetical protein